MMLHCDITMFCPSMMTTHRGTVRQGIFPLGQASYWATGWESQQKAVPGEATKVLEDLGYQRLLSYLHILDRIPVSKTKCSHVKVCN